MESSEGWTRTGTGFDRPMELVIGRWYYYWTTSLREGVMGLGWLASIRETREGVRLCRFMSNTNVVYEVPAEDVIGPRGTANEELGQVPLIGS